MWSPAPAGSSSPNQLEVTAEDGTRTPIDFRQAIIAAGSEPVTLPFLPKDDPRVIDSTGALELSSVPERLLVIGGGIIGLEMGTVFAAFGARVTVVELLDQLIPGADPDLVKPLASRIRGSFEKIHLGTKVTAVSEAAGDGATGRLEVRLEGPDAPATDTFDQILVAVGRRPNGGAIGAEAAGVQVDERGFIAVDKQQRTNVEHIFAIGDIVGQPMLAHKATHEGHVAAEVAAGQARPTSTPGSFPRSPTPTPRSPGWARPKPKPRQPASPTARRRSPGRPAAGPSPSAAPKGSPSCSSTRRRAGFIGCGIVGPNAGDLISEAALAIELGADAADVALTIHPHPTLSETIGLAAEAFEGTITDLYLPKRR